MIRLADSATAPPPEPPPTPSLGADNTTLRERVLDRQQTAIPNIPTLPLIDAQTWSEHGDSDWLIWRAHRVAARLREMPLSTSAGERIAGCPELRPPTAAEACAIEAVRAQIESIPPFPGGDSGHFHPDFDKLFRLGIGGLIDEIESQGSGAADAQAAFYRACGIAMEGLADYCRRVADACEATGGPHAATLTHICRRIAGEPPATFHEAIQLMFLTIVALWFGEDHGLTTPGRMDQTLRRFYEADVAAGRLTRAEALELISCLYIQLNALLGPGAAISVLVGGRDSEGRDVTSELTYLCLEARQATQLVYPTVGVAWHEGTPEELTDFAGRMLATGIGDPAFFNDELISAGLRDHGVSEADSCNYMNSTCVEIKVVGTSNIWVASPYFNCAQALLDVIDDVVDASAPAPADFEAIEDLLAQRLTGLVSAAAEQLDDVWQRRAETGGFPLGSCFIADCLERGADFDRGGARYHWAENSFVGLANLVDGLLAIRQLVFESGELTLVELRAVLRADFAGHEPLRQRILNRLSSYGNDDGEVDALAVEWAERLQAITAAQSVGGHRYVPGYFCWIMHGHLGAATGATPDGRRAGVALADGAGAAQGRERHGPTASVLSTTKWSHRQALGGLVHNVRLSQNLLRNDAGRGAMRDLIETYLRRGGFEIQVNVVSTEVLRDAQENPEAHADLLVRVAGYSDYFVHLDATLQAEVIARTEHQAL